VAAAIDTIGWYSGLIPAKIGRALHGAANEGQWVDDDPVQNDWNGSAKVARLAIAESIAAWRTLFEAGDTPVDASIRETANLLAQMDRDLAARVSAGDGIRSAGLRRASRCGRRADAAGAVRAAASHGTAAAAVVVVATAPAGSGSPRRNRADVRLDVPRHREGSHDHSRRPSSL
jgi:hypothetical protein